MEELETHHMPTQPEHQEQQRQLGHMALYEAPKGVEDTQSWDQNVQAYFGE